MEMTLLSDILKIAFIFLLAVALLAVASFFALRIIIKGKEIETPNVIGRSYIDASKILSTQGLNCRIEGEKYSAKLPEGHIKEQDPVPKQKVKLGRVIKVFLSKGTELGQVPRLIGYPIADVESKLTSAGLEMGSVVKVHSDDFPQENIVIAHTPQADVTAQWGSKVNFLVSLGAHPVTLMMPDLKGMEQQKALEALERRGLRQGRITHEASSTAKAGVVIEQSHRANDRIARGVAVDIWVSSGETSEETWRTATLSYIVPVPIKTSEDSEDPEQEQEDLSPRNVEIILEHDGAAQSRVIVKDFLVPHTPLSRPCRIKGLAYAKIYVDEALAETMICKPPSRVFVKQ